MTRSASSGTRENARNSQNVARSRRAAVADVDAVPREHPFESPLVAGRQSGAVGVEPPQELEHVLLRAALVDIVGVPERLGLGARSVERADVGEEVEEGVLAGRQPGVGRAARRHHGAVGGAQRPGRRGVEVEAEQVGGEVLEHVGGGAPVVLGEELGEVDCLLVGATGQVGQQP